MDHVAILKPAYLELILTGEKTVEARLSQSRRAPFGRVRAWERVFLKASGGPLIAVATVRWVRQFEGLTPGLVEQISRDYGSAVRAPFRFWHERRHARYATLIRLDGARVLDPGERFEFTKRSPRDAWVCLDDESSLSAA